MAEISTAEERRETRLLGALAVTLAALAAWQLAGDLDGSAAETIAQAVRPPLVAEAPSVAARDTSAIIERPLFAPGRRRISPIATAVAAPAPPPPAPPPLAKKFMLVGLLVVDGETRVMLREIAGAGPTRRLRPGDTVEGWTLAAIEPRRAARFERPEGREVLRLAHPSGGVAAARPQDDDEDEEE